MGHDSIYWNINLPGMLFVAMLITVPVLLTTWLATSKQPSRRRWGFRLTVLGVLALLCPCTQWVALEPIHMHQLESMGDKVRAEGVEGRRKEDVQKLLGAPSWVSGSRPGFETWEYKPVPFYLLGATLQVHFKGDVVTGWENYDN